MTTTWQTHPYRVRTFVKFWVPNVVYQAQVLGSSFTYPIKELPTDSENTIQGSIYDLEIGMTVLIGSSAGEDDLGRIYVRNTSQDGTTIPIGRASRGTRFGELNLSAGAYVTVLDHYDVFSKIPFISDDGTEILKNETTFAANIAQPPIAHAGPHIANFADSVTDLLTVDFDASDTTIIMSGAGTPTYEWDFGPGATPETTTGVTVDGVTFPSGEPRWIKLTVYHNSVTHTTRRVIYAAPAIGTNDCPDEVTSDTYRFNRKPEGQTFNCRVKSDISDFIDGGIALVMQKEDFGSTEGPLVGSSLLKFIGYHTQDNDDIQAGPDGTIKEVNLTFEDFLMRTQSRGGFSQVVIRKNTAQTWNHLENADIDRYLHYLIHWHSTLAEVTGVTLSGQGSSYPVTTLGSGEGKLYKQLDDRTRAIKHRLTSNFEGMVQVLPDPMRFDVADRTSDIIVDIDESDWSRIHHNRDYYPRINWLKTSAIVASATQIPVVFSRAPGDSPGQGVSPQSVSQMLVTGQTELNATTGHDYARLNAEDGVFTVELAHAGDIGIDPAEMKWVRMTISAATAAQKGLTFTDARFLVLESDIVIDPLTGSQKVTIKIEKETIGTPGVTYIPPDYNFNFPDYDFQIDDFIIPEIQLGGDGLDSGAGIFAVLDEDAGLHVTDEWTAITPTWQDLDLTAFGFDDTNALDFRASPFSPAYVSRGEEVDTLIAGNESIWLIRDTLGQGLTLTRVHSFTNSMDKRQISFSRGIKDWAIIASWDEDGNVEVAWTRDLENWEESTITTESLTGNLKVEDFYPGLWMSPFKPGFAIASAWFNSEDNDASIATAYYTLDYGRNWNIFTLPDINPDVFLSETIQIPFELAVQANVAFYGRSTFSDPGYDMRLYRAIGTNVTDISPIISTFARGPIHSPRSFDISDADANRLYLIAFNSDGDDEASNEYYGIWGTTNALDTTPSWYQIVGAGSSVTWWKIFASSNDVDILIVISTDGQVAWATDGGSSGLTDKTGDMTHGKKLVGIVSGQGLNLASEPPLPALQNYSSTAVGLNDDGDLGYTEDLESRLPSYTGISPAVTGTIADVTIDYACDYVAAADGTGQLDIFAVTIDGTSVYVYWIEDVTGTPSVTLMRTLTLLDAATAVDPRIVTDSQDDQLLGVVFGDKNGTFYAYTGNHGTNWLGSTTVTASGSADPQDFSDYDIGANTRNGAFVAGSTGTSANTDELVSATKGVYGGGAPVRYELYSQYPFTSIINVLANISYAAKPARSTTNPTSVLYDFDLNDDYDIEHGTLAAVGYSGDGIQDDDLANNLIINCYLPFPMRLSNLSFQWKYTEELHADFSTITLYGVCYDSAGNIYGGTDSQVYDLDSGSPDEWLTFNKPITGTDRPIHRVRVILTGSFSTGDYRMVLDNVLISIIESIDSSEEPQLFKIDPWNGANFTAVVTEVTPSGSGGYVPWKTYGLAMSQDADYQNVAILGKDVSSNKALCRTSNGALSWLAVVLTDDYDQLCFNQNIFAVWGPDGIAVSDNSGGKLSEKIGDWASAVGNTSIKKFLVLL